MDKPLLKVLVLKREGSGIEANRTILRMPHNRAFPLVNLGMIGKEFIVYTEIGRNRSGGFGVALSQFQQAFAHLLYRRHYLGLRGKRGNGYHQSLVARAEQHLLGSAVPFNPDNAQLGIFHNFFHLHKSSVSMMQS
jgi:hypothetical protein